MLLLIILVSLLSCSAQLCQKQATRAVSRRTRLSWIGVSVLLLGVAMLLWLLVLQRVPVSQAYPMLSLNFIFVALAGRLLWRERLTPRQITGTLLVVTGVALMASQI
ncbi:MULTISPECIES: 4-amino-4-deoxy-L-arabinose-phosphoundecaprenol flippase subunit ArnE [Pantoea]|jgi:undecaprenyl phosphate-alpha-L-ara4N flippase subunit ArnE|uniref:4-amino-4-deoxy-L-arabinose-phosphoundecaprenol flippase subunit ArnE n=1 Tax=Pantoea anthophila TaxID=470931 RepID=A0ABY2Z802_9GAMM|nr:MULTISPECIES: 4-amino-4-deoxy-L-arabinose-phosphoundecaprenol flippase subunit ArnE [Pantoea]TPE10804.1 4-amino-4-deoxy-L-arabinose-phosphoundecaprenol flippase subunit ArnE [Pantoea vagans]EIB96379.1 inner membrane protein yfbw [Pantoea sp. Sc1]MEB5707867.1 4-amino-4-deoxy-L-arabinose-phosphoundecaprenol flippase subunit ArnE [Pantoea anthophila]MEB6225273.1 4-amino-4-deoxy-L-arabinose-phosphoundecaprenol flippase subunit ArnE [Pantoea anthophila]MEB6518738.1 4-amino-4-deoxy-L-arabinose-ph